MQAIFTYGGNRKSAITPRTILFGTASRTYDPNANYPVFSVVGNLPLTQEQAAGAADIGSLNTVQAVLDRITLLKQGIAALTDFEAKARAWYDSRLANTNSPGHSDSIRNERAAICDQALRELALLKAALITAQAKAGTLATAAQTTFDPTKGAVAPPASGGGSSTPPASGLSSLIVPVGAALAALFFLKGH